MAESVLIDRNCLERRSAASQRCSSEVDSKRSSSMASNLERISSRYEEAPLMAYDKSRISLLGRSATESLSSDFDELQAPVMAASASVKHRAFWATVEAEFTGERSGREAPGRQHLEMQEPQSVAVRPEQCWND